MVDMLIYVEQVCLLIYFVVVCYVNGDVDVWCKVVLVVKVWVGLVVCFVGQQVVQLYGGMGVINEVVVVYLFKWLLIIEMIFGDIDYYFVCIVVLFDFVQIDVV